MTSETRSGARVPIAKRAREARVAGYIPTDIESNKEQLYIALSVLTDDLVQQVLDRRDDYPPFGFVEEFSATKALFGDTDPVDFSQAEDPFKLLDEKLRHTFYYHVRHFIDNPDKPDLIRTTNGNLYINAVECLIARDDPASPYEFVSRGVNTATAFMCGALRVIKQLTPEMSAEERLAIAQNTYPTLKYLASKNLMEIRTYFHAFEEGNGTDGRSDVLKNEFVELVNTPQGLRLIIKRPENHGQLLLMGDMRELDHTVGCPASHNLGSGSAMRKMYSWVLEIVDKAGLFQTTD